MDKSRWGEPLSYAEADALATRFREGDLISLQERWRRFQHLIADWIDTHDRKTRYAKLGEIREHMREMGLTQVEEEVDDVLLEQSICESICAAQCSDKTGPDADECFWPCMRECSPVDPGAHEAPPSDVDPDLLSPTTYSVAPSGLIVPRNIRRDGQ